MICITKVGHDTAQNLSFRYAMMGKNQWPKNHTSTEATGTAFAVK